MGFISKDFDDVAWDAMLGVCVCVEGLTVPVVYCLVFFPVLFFLCFVSLLFTPW